MILEFDRRILFDPRLLLRPDHRLTVEELLQLRFQRRRHPRLDHLHRPLRILRPRVQRLVERNSVLQLHIIGPYPIPRQSRPRNHLLFQRLLAQICFDLPLLLCESHLRRAQLDRRRPQPDRFRRRPRLAHRLRHHEIGHPAQILHHHLNRVFPLPLRPVLFGRHLEEAESNPLSLPEPPDFRRVELAPHRQPVQLRRRLHAKRFELRDALRRPLQRLDRLFDRIERRHIAFLLLGILFGPPPLDRPEAHISIFIPFGPGHPLPLLRRRLPVRERHIRHPQLPQAFHKRFHVAVVQDDIESGHAFDHKAASVSSLDLTIFWDDFERFSSSSRKRLIFLIAS